MAGLPTRELGMTGLEVTMLGYGAMELGGNRPGREVTPELADTVLNTVLDSGINFIDTSPDYGQSEDLIGRSIGRRRSEFFLASKCGCLAMEPPAHLRQYVTENRGPHLYTAANVVAAVEQSLRRMKTDYLDLVQVHMTPSQAQLEQFDALEGLAKVKEQGKARSIGMSGTLPHIRDHIAMGIFEVFQVPYSALAREHEDIISDAAQKGAGIIIRGGAARGAPAKEQGDTFDIWKQADLDSLLEEGMTRMELTLRFTFSHPHMHTNIVGTINLDHLMDNLRSLQKGPLPADLYEEAKRRLAAAGSTPEPVRV